MCRKIIFRKYDNDLDYGDTIVEESDYNNSINVEGADYFCEQIDKLGDPKDTYDCECEIVIWLKRCKNLFN